MMVVSEVFQDIFSLFRGAPKMTRTFGLSVVFVLLGLLSSASWVQAQTPKPKAPDGSGSGAMRITLMGPATEMINIMHMAIFQRELKITSDQRKLIDQVEREVSSGAQSNLPAQPEDPDERKEAQQKIDDHVRTVEDKAAERFNEILQPKQLKRLKEIYLQLAGPRALIDKDIAEALELSDEQKKQLKALNVEYLSKLRKDRNPQAQHQVMGEWSRKADKILTSEQRTKLKKMAGKSIRG